MESVETSGHLKATVSPKRRKTSWKRGQSGNPSGKPKGTLNQATREIRESARALLEDPKGQQAMLRLYRKGKLHPAIVVRMHDYAYGKPKETVEIQTTEKPIPTMSTEEIKRELIARAKATLAQLEGESPIIDVIALPEKAESLALSES